MAVMPVRKRDSEATQRPRYGAFRSPAARVANSVASAEEATATVAPARTPVVVTPSSEGAHPAVVIRSSVGTHREADTRSLEVTRREEATLAVEAGTLAVAAVILVAAATLAEGTRVEDTSVVDTAAVGMVAGTAKSRIA